MEEKLKRIQWLIDNADRIILIEENGYGESNEVEIESYDGPENEISLVVGSLDFDWGFSYEDLKLSKIEDGRLKIADCHLYFYDCRSLIKNSNEE